jgi:hypothetical protein
VIEMRTLSFSVRCPGSPSCVSVTVFVLMVRCLVAMYMLFGTGASAAKMCVRCYSDLITMVVMLDTVLSGD